MSVQSLCNLTSIISVCEEDVRILSLDKRLDNIPRQILFHLGTYYILSQQKFIPYSLQYSNFGWDLSWQYKNVWSDDDANNISLIWNVEPSILFCGKTSEIHCVTGGHGAFLCLNLPGTKHENHKKLLSYDQKVAGSFQANGDRHIERKFEETLN